MGVEGHVEERGCPRKMAARLESGSTVLQSGAHLSSVPWLSMVKKKTRIGYIWRVI